MGSQLSKWKGWAIALLTAALVSGTGLALADAPEPASATTLTEAHNQYRSEVGVPALQGSEPLARSAQAWADQLAATNTFRHSGSRYGENLWKGTAGAYSLTERVGSWAAEKRNFRNGTFPNVSTTGNWADVGHYTQMIWKNTTEVGCGLATGNGWDVLVCQYNPPGNVRGQRPF